MAFVGKELRVVLATWHIPLCEVATSLDAATLEKAVYCAHRLAKRLGVKIPRIGVCGINPHAGEGGILGQEEFEVLDPALDRLREKIPGLSRCLPGDTVFHRQRQGDFDVVVCCLSRSSARSSQDARVRLRRQPHARLTLRAHQSRSRHRV